MTPTLKYTEKTIGWLQIALGGLMLFGSVWAVTEWYNIYIEYMQGPKWKNLIFILNKFHFGFIYSILGILSGILILLNKKTGWILTIISSIMSVMIGVTSLYSIFTNNKKNVSTVLPTILFFTLISIFLFVLIFLLSKPLQSKYNPTKKNWLIILTAILLLLADVIITK